MPIERDHAGPADDAAGPGTRAFRPIHPLSIGGRHRGPRSRLRAGGDPPYPVRPAARPIAWALLASAVARSRRTARHLQPPSPARRPQPVIRKGTPHVEELVIALTVALSPAMLFAQKVSYDYEKSADFAAFKTYALKDGTKVGQPLIDESHRGGHRAGALREGPHGKSTPTRTSSSSTTRPSTSRRTSPRSAPGLWRRLRAGTGWGWGGGGWAGGTTHDPGARHPHGHARDRHRRRQEEAARLARDRAPRKSTCRRSPRSGTRAISGAVEEDLQELSAEIRARGGRAYPLQESPT